MLRPYIMQFPIMISIPETPNPDETEKNASTDETSQDDSQVANEQAEGGNSEDAPEGNPT